MILPINSVSFKGFYMNPNVKFSDSQMDVINDIKTKLKQESSKKNFYFDKGAGEDTVSLTQWNGMEKFGRGVEKRATYRNAVYIGTYNKACPFVREDIDAANEEHSKNDSLHGLAFLPIALFALGAFIFCKNPAVNNKAIDKTNQTIKADSLKSLTKDTLNLLKK